MKKVIGWLILFGIFGTISVFTSLAIGIEATIYTWLLAFIGTGLVFLSVNLID